MGWYRQDAFLHPDNAEFDPTQSAPGKIGGVAPDPKTMAKPAENAIRENHCTDENLETRNETAKGNDTPSPVSEMEISDEEYHQPGRQEDGEVEGEPGYYEPGTGAANLFGPDAEEEADEQ